MPAKSEAQRRLMQAVKHEPAVAKKTGISKASAEKVLGETDSASSKSHMQQHLDTHQDLIDKLITKGSK